MNKESNAENREKTEGETAIPSTGRLAGIDYGTVRIGVAVTDPDRMIASPLDNYSRLSDQADAAFFCQLVKEERITGFIVGLPVHTDGNESQKSQEARQFGKWLSVETDRPVDFFDERYTSTFAHEILSMGGMTNKKKKKRLDMIAAQIMLTAYLESNRQQSNLNLQDTDLQDSDLQDSDLQDSESSDSD